MFLTDVEYFDVCNFPDFPEHVHFSTLVKVLFQFRRGIKVVFDGSLRMTADDNDFIDSAGQDFFYNVLNGGFVHNGQHFLRHSLRSRKEPGAESGSRNDRFSDFLHNSP